MTRPALRLRKGEASHRFGGDWTTRKLDVLAKYLTGYTTALKNAPFDKWYVDAFAGTGYRDARPAGGLDTATDWLLLPDLADQEPQSLLDGSARRALTTAPPFDRYVFIEQSAGRCANLESLGAEFPNLSAAVEVRHGDANPELQALCAEDWRARRAVLFLDPYGMQVECDRDGGAALVKELRHPYFLAKNSSHVILPGLTVETLLASVACNPPQTTLLEPLAHIIP